MLKEEWSGKITNMSVNWKGGNLNAFLGGGEESNDRLQPIIWAFSSALY